MKKVIKPSTNIEDDRVFGSPMTSVSIPENKAANTQRASALGLSGAAADLQNTANKLQAVRRTRVSLATRTEQLSSIMNKGRRK